MPGEPVGLEDVSRIEEGPFRTDRPAGRGASRGLGLLRPASGTRRSSRTRRDRRRLECSRSIRDGRAARLPPLPRAQIAFAPPALRCRAPAGLGRPRDAGRGPVSSRKARRPSPRRPRSSCPGLRARALPNREAPTLAGVAGRRRHEDLEISRVMPGSHRPGGAGVPRTGGDAASAADPGADGRARASGSAADSGAPSRARRGGFADFQLLQPVDLRHRELPRDRGAQPGGQPALSPAEGVGAFTAGDRGPVRPRGLLHILLERLRGRRGGLRDVHAAAGRSAPEGRQVQGAVRQDQHAPPPRPPVGRRAASDDQSARERGRLERCRRFAGKAHSPGRHLLGADGAGLPRQDRRALRRPVPLGLELPRASTAPTAISETTTTSSSARPGARAPTERPPTRRRRSRTSTSSTAGSRSRGARIAPSSCGASSTAAAASSRAGPRLPAASTSPATTSSPSGGSRGPATNSRTARTTRTPGIPAGR